MPTVNNSPILGHKKKIIGGNELTMEEYAAYLNALQVKPFLTAVEAATLFDIGVTRVRKLMNEEDANFVMMTGKSRRRRIHRETFEKYQLESSPSVASQLRVMIAIRVLAICSSSGRTS